MKHQAAFISYLLAGLLLAGSAAHSRAQTLNVPPRATNAVTGSQWANICLEMSQQSREQWVLYEVTQGNLPGWMRTMVPITVNQTINGVAHSLTYYVIPDYVAIGSDTDYFLEPMSPILAQRLANLLNCTLPTALMVNQIWTNSPVKLAPSTVTPTNNNNATVPVFVLQDSEVMSLRNAVTNAHPLGTLVSGDKKDIVESTLIYTNFFNSSVTNVVVIYGWIQPNGVPIQSIFNGHSETYMDYSHGIRLVQMGVMLDGVSNTVTNILNDPVLNPLLSNEGVIAKPYYTLDNFFSPFIISQPASENIRVGDTANLSVTVVGVAPFTYQWKLNGASVSGGTNSALTLVNAQATNAGTYTVVISNGFTPATSIPAILRVSTNAYPLLFSDDLSVDTSANWSFFFGSAGSPDYTTNWAFDYSAIPYNWNGATYLIPPAPSTTNGSTRGLRFTVNDSNGVIAGVNVYPKNQSFSNNFALKFDMWINYPGTANGGTNTGTTEFALCGINHLGTEPNWAATNAASTDGLWFAVDGEGGSSRDYRDYAGNPSGIQTDLTGAASGLVAAYHTNAPFPTDFPANRFESAGVPGKNWVGGEIDQSNGGVTWMMDGNVIAQRSNTSIYTNGNIMIGYMDIFASVANPLSDAFVLFNNVRVEDRTPQPFFPPTVTVSPTNPVVAPGTNLTFNGTITSGTPPFTYQWKFNGVNISNATGSSLPLMSVQPTNSGFYSILVGNLAGSATNGTTLTVTSTASRFNSSAKLSNGTFRFTFTGTVGALYGIQTSSNLFTWLPLTNVTDNSNPVTFIDTNLGLPRRYYRLVTPPPP